MLAYAPKQPQIINEAGVDEAVFARALEGLRFYFRRFDEDFTRQFAARYIFELQKVSDYYGEITFTWNAVPREGEPRTEEREWGTKTFHAFRAPKERVVQEVPQNGDWAYRGMSWEEWQAIRRSKFIQSRGVYNIGQAGMTLFGDQADTAVYYASGFTPVAFKPGLRRPGVVIAIPKELTEGPSQAKNIPDGERAVFGRLSWDHIQAVWYLIPVAIEAGYFELVYKKYPPRTHPKYHWSEGSGRGVSVNFAIVQAFPEALI